MLHAALPLGRMAPTICACEREHVRGSSLLPPHPGWKPLQVCEACFLENTHLLGFCCTNAWLEKCQGATWAALQAPAQNRAARGACDRASMARDGVSAASIVSWPTFPSNSPLVLHLTTLWSSLQLKSSLSGLQATAATSSACPLADKGPKFILMALSS